MKKLFTFILLSCIVSLHAIADTPILGTNVATAERMYQFVKSQNSSFDKEIAEQFIAVSQVYGVRGDIAICQSIIETGWFKYTGGTAVTAEDHNYCGLGVTTLGEKGCIFSTIKEGVTAQIQHLYAYACTKSIPSGETLIDPRFQWVTRGSAPNWEDLGSGKWASAAGYGDKIIAMYNDMMAFNVTGDEGSSTPSTPTTTSLTASTTSVSLSGTCGGTATSASVKITGTNLPYAIIYNSSSSAFLVSTSSDWNSMTGGTMTITLDTSKAAGSYTGYIAVQSGSDKTIRVEINCTGTLTESSSETPSTPSTPSTPTTLPDQFGTDWSYSASAGTSTSWMNPSNDYTRNMTLCNGKLYVVQRDPDNSTANIHIINAYTGVASGTLPKSGLTNDGYMFASVANMGGTIVACNLAYGATSTLRVYSWSSDSATPSVVLETTTHGDRAGDLMSASGTISSGKLYFASNEKDGKIYVYTVTNGIASSTPTVVTLKDANGSAYDLGGGYAVVEIKANADGTFWATGKAGVPALFNANGTLIRQLSTTAVDNNVNGSSFTPFDFGNYKLAAVVSYKTGVQQGYLNLVDITNGEVSATKIKSYDTLGASGVSNGTFVTTSIAEVNGSTIHLWVLIPKQGVAKYTASTISGIETVIYNSIDITVWGNMIKASSAKSITLISMTGQIIASTDSDELNTDNISSGVYIAVATLIDGSRLTKKIAIRN